MRILAKATRTDAGEIPSLVCEGDTVELLPGESIAYRGIVFRAAAMTRERSTDTDRRAEVQATASEATTTPTEAGDDGKPTTVPEPIPYGEWRREAGGLVYRFAWAVSGGVESLAKDIARNARIVIGRVAMRRWNLTTWPAGGMVEFAATTGRGEEYLAITQEVVYDRVEDFAEALGVTSDD